MIKRTATIVLILLACFSIFACGPEQKPQVEEKAVVEKETPAVVEEKTVVAKAPEPIKETVVEKKEDLGEDLEIEAKILLDGAPASGAIVLVDGKEAGTTDENGHFIKTIKRRPGSEIEVAAEMERQGYRVEPWKDMFVMKLPKEGAVDRYPFTINLKSSKYVTLQVTHKGEPVKSASIRINKKKIGVTDPNGKVVYNFNTVPRKKVSFVATKKNFASAKRTVKLVPGEVIDLPLTRETILTIKALKEEFGLTSRLPGVDVSINNKVIGKTNPKGVLVYKYRGTPGKKVQLRLAAEGYQPPVWKTTVELTGRKNIQRYFYPPPIDHIRAGIFGYVSNSPEADLASVIQRCEDSIANSLFSYLSFQEVQQETLREEIQNAKLNIDSVMVNGWENTPLMRTVDLIIFGSVTKDNTGLTIETKAVTSDGKPVVGRIDTTARLSDIKIINQEAIEELIEKYPFKGAVVAADDYRQRINLGRNAFEIEPGMEFTLGKAKYDRYGKRTGFNEVGILQVKNAESNGSWTEIVELQKGAKVSVGDLVTRRFAPERQRAVPKEKLIIMARGGIPPEIRPLAGVNIYLDQQWSGTTDSRGRVKIPVRLGRNYDLTLYRHGYQQVSEMVSADIDNETREFTLTINKALLKLESEPSGASVYIDGKKIGKTPLMAGELVDFGFHNLRVAVGGDFRDYKKVVEFSKQVVDFTGENKIYLFKDFLKAGKRAENQKDFNKAIREYSTVDRSHPDYAASRTRLARIYMDEKNNYGAAIREFQNVLSLPEHQLIIFKQYAVTYTNLGHAQYEMGNSVAKKNPKLAAEYFAKAIKNLQTAVQNTRFFPTETYDEAVHDTYYYLAISYHKLYMVTRNNALLVKADIAWRNYFDFFPKRFEKNTTFTHFRKTAEKYWAEVKDLK